MNGAILVELRFFGTSVLWGVFLLVIYDFLRIERRLISHNSFFVAVEDLIYWVIASLLIFNMMFNLNDGIIRGFSILGMLIGMLLYHHILSNYFVDITAGILIAIKNVIVAVINFILQPFKFLSKKLRKFTKFITTIIKKLTKNLRKTLKKTSKASKITVNDNDMNEIE